MDEPNKNDENYQARQINANFEEIFYQSPIGIFCYDKNGRLTNANNSALNITRIPKLDDVLGTNLFDNPLIASKKEELHENRLIRFQDSLDLIKINEQNIYNPLEPKLIDIDWTVSVTDSGYLIQIQDITDNKKNVETIKEYEATYRGLFESLDEAIQICELVFDDEEHPIDNIILDVNPAYEKQTGLKRDEVIGRNIKSILPIVEQIWLDRYGEVVCEGKSMHFEEYNEGINRWFDVHATPLKDNKFSAVFTDITERKKIEEALKSNQELFKKTFDSVSFAVSIVRVSDNQIIDINEAYLRMIEYNKEEVVGHTAKELQVFPNYEEREKIARLAHDGKQVRNQEIDVRTKSGKILRALFSVDLINFDNQPHFLGSLINITDRKKAEEAVKRSEERLSAVLDNTRDVIVSFNLKTEVYEFVSPSVVDLVGYSSDEFINMGAETALEMIHPDDVILLQEARARANEIGYAEVEYRQLHKNREYIWVSNSISVQKDSSSKPIYRISSLRDITERKKAEMKARNILENISENYSEFDNKWHFVDVNNKMQEEFGIKRDDVIGKVVWELFPQTVGNKQYKEFHRAKKENISIRFESKSLLDNKWYEINAYPHPEGLSVYSHDITRRKKAEIELMRSKEKIFEIMESIQDNLYVLDYEWNYVYINKQSASAIGVEPQDFIGQNHWKMFPQYMGTVLEDNFREVMEKREVRRFEIYSPYNNNWFIVSVYPSEEGITVLGSNITERKNIEEDLQITMDELKRSNNELKQFAYVTSHDLREPLRMITSFLQLLERRYKDQLDKDANEFIDFAVNGAKRLDAMTNALLQYSKISSEKREVIPVDFEDVLKHALTNLKIQIEENNAIITHDPLPTIMGNEKLKVQLFQNIIANAIKYRGHETPKIHISSSKEKNQYLFSIKDNGIGISNKHLEKIFTIFQRLHTNEEYEGTGIGLAIAQKIVHQQGGQIWAESELEKGTTFYFTIPIKP